MPIAVVVKRREWKSIKKKDPDSGRFITLSEPDPPDSQHQQPGHQQQDIERPQQLQRATQGNAGAVDAQGEQAQVPQHRRAIRRRGWRCDVMAGW